MKLKSFFDRFSKKTDSERLAEIYGRLLIEELMHAVNNNLYGIIVDAMASANPEIGELLTQFFYDHVSLDDYFFGFDLVARKDFKYLSSNLTFREAIAPENINTIYTNNRKYIYVIKNMAEDAANKSNEYIISVDFTREFQFTKRELDAIFGVTKSYIESRSRSAMPIINLRAVAITYALELVTAMQVIAEKKFASFTKFQSLNPSLSFRSYDGLIGYTVSTELNELETLSSEKIARTYISGLNLASTILDMGRYVAEAIHSYSLIAPIQDMEYDQLEDRVFYRFNQWGQNEINKEVRRMCAWIYKYQLYGDSIEIYKTILINPRWLLRSMPSLTVSEYVLKHKERPSARIFHLLENGKASLANNASNKIYDTGDRPEEVSLISIYDDIQRIYDEAQEHRTIAGTAIYIWSYIWGVILQQNGYQFNVTATDLGTNLYKRAINRDEFTPSHEEQQDLIDNTAKAYAMRVVDIVKTIPNMLDELKF